MATTPRAARGHRACAIVVGAGMAGLLAARVLTETFDQVHLLDADRLPSGDDHRRGVPQSRHPHALLQRGADVLEHLFPGLRDELTTAGAPVYDHGSTFLMWFAGAWAPRIDSGLQIQAFSRPLLECRIRSRTLSLPGVILHPDTIVEGLRTDRPGRRVTGVDIRRPGHQPTSLEADMVVVAGGRTARLASWLTAIGRAEPDIRVVDARTVYASREYTGLPGEWNGLAEMALAPDTTRGGAVTRIENGRAIAALHGTAGDRPPTDEAGFLAFARSLGNPLLGELLAAARPVSPVYRCTDMANRRIDYHRIPDWPEGLLAIGDTVCSFNPVYAQGMTLAALQALELRAFLHPDRPAPAARVFQRRVRRLLTTPWTLSTCEDLAWSGTGGIADRTLHRYLRQVLARIPDDPGLYRRFLRTLHMVASPAGLLRPVPLARSLIAPLAPMTHASLPARTKGPR
ncbi:MULTISPECIES: NAD(P)-binding protein [unclassified Nonomuraea]|uniref:NAD(P)/FAD-dependent oxidoreductase n=1 Tax=unclassified Nonomuraea TaxID=2593643 RepID=UPI00340ABBDF